jgi:hypothetical protein
MTLQHLFFIQRDKIAGSDPRVGRHGRLEMPLKECYFSVFNQEKTAQGEEIFGIDRQLVRGLR